MSHYLIFVLGMVVGGAAAMFVYALCLISGDISRQEEMMKDEKQVAKYMLEQGGK